MNWLATSLVMLIAASGCSPDRNDEGGAFYSAKKSVAFLPMSTLMKNSHLTPAQKKRAQEIVKGVSDDDFVDILNVAPDSGAIASTLKWKFVHVDKKGYVSGVYKVTWRNATNRDIRVVPGKIRFTDKDGLLLAQGPSGLRTFNCGIGGAHSEDGNFSVKLFSKQIASSVTDVSIVLRPSTGSIIDDALTEGK
jgi:hypothetical protein